MRSSRMTDRSWTTRKMPRPRIIDCHGQHVEFGGLRHEIRLRCSDDPLPIPGDLVCARVGSGPTKTSRATQFDIHVRVEEVGDTSWIRGVMIGRWNGAEYKEFASRE